MARTKESLLKQELEVTKKDLGDIVARLNGEWDLHSSMQEQVNGAMDRFEVLAEALTSADEIKVDDYARGMAAAYKDAQHRLGYILYRNEIENDVLSNTHEIPLSYFD